MKSKFIERDIEISMNEWNVDEVEEEIEDDRPGQELESFDLRECELLGSLRFNAPQIGPSFGKRSVARSPNGLVGTDLERERSTAFRADVHQRIGEEPEVGAEDGQEVEGGGAQRSSAGQVAGQKNGERESG